MTATAPRLLRISGLDGLAVSVLWLVAASGGIVFREPAPYDALLAAAMAGFVLAGMTVPRSIAPLAAALLVYLAGNFIAGARASRIDEATAHAWITFYLSLSILFFACAAAWSPGRAVNAILAGALAGALIAALAGIAGYFALLPGASELFTLYGRARGTFKDPNVFGPFLVLALLYVVARLITARPGAALVWCAPAAILLAGLFLSFSRGAWLHAGVSLTLFVFLSLTCLRDRVLTTRTTLVAILAVFVLAAGLGLALSNDKVSSLLGQRAAIVQSYDVGVHGRFAGQQRAVGIIIDQPLGIGFREFERYHPEQPHNVYLNVFLNSGWLGGFAYLAIVLMTLTRAVTVALRDSPVQPLAIALCATFCGLLVEGFLVDTDHWRHFMLVVGLIWGMAAGRGRWIEAPPVASDSGGPSPGQPAASGRQVAGQ